MARRTVLILAAALVVTACLPALARQNIVVNGSLEAGPGQGGANPFIPAGWTESGNVQNIERSLEANRTPGGEAALKAFGETATTSISAYQRISAAPGDIITVTTYLYTRTGDKLGGSGEAGIRLAFLNSNSQPITPPGQTIETYPLNASSDVDTWIPATLTYTAPANTAMIQVTCRLKWAAGNISGAAFWDDLTVTGASGGAIYNGDFEIAGVSTEPNPFGIDDWFGFNDQQKSDEAAYEGAWSVKLGRNAGYSGLVQEMGTAQDGDRILLIARGMIPSTDQLNGGARAGIKLEFASFSAVPPPEENLAFDETAPADTWQTISLITTVPAEVTKASIVLIFTGNAGSTGSVHLDQAVAKRNSGSNLLFNPGMEDGPGGPQGLDSWTEFYTDGTSQAQKSCYIGFEYDDCTARATGAEVAGLKQEIDVVAGDALEIAAQFYTPSTDKLTGTAKAGVKVEWVAGNVPDWVDLCDPGQNNCLPAGSTPDVWHEMTIDYTMPPLSAAKIKFTNILDKGTATQGRVYIDGCEAIILNVVDGSDYDGDGDEDLADFAAFQTCFNAGVGELGWSCRVFDLDPATDGDGDVDLADYSLFQPNLTGPQ